jgi:hypothetical protein
MMAAIWRWAMISFVIWIGVAAGLFLYNHFDGQPFIGVLGTQRLLGFPLDGGFLASGVALYCLIRYFVRRKRQAKEAGL